MKFEYLILEKNNVLVVSFEGRILDRSDATELLVKMDDYLALGKNKVIVNMKNIDYMNSAGLNVLITLLTNTRNAYGVFYICDVPERVKKLLITSKLDNIFNIELSEEEALNKFN